jgi:beta-glucosidase
VDEKEATRLAILAGIDDMVPSDYTFSDLLVQLVNERRVPMSRVDEAVRRILRLKFDLGLFENPTLSAPMTSFATPESRQVNLQPRESMTLQK